MPTIAEADVSTVAAATLGGPGPADPERCSRMVIEALSRAAGQGMRITSLALELAAQPLGQGEIVIRTTVDKRTRAIVFASAKAKAGDMLVFSAQSLFSPAGGSK